MEPTTQTICDDAVDDMQPEAGAALAAARREEWIERPVPDIETHAAAIVGENNFDIVLPRRPHPDVDDACLAVGKRVRDRVEEQVGQHLAVRAGIAFHRQIGRALDIEKWLLLSRSWSQALG